jgi:TetR/AcrR family transcriptional regulator, regulator of cefoperazone and chloramphenicol sensitivity
MASRTGVDTKYDDPTRAKLLDAAGNVFAEYGFRAATVREICARANANVAAVNYHFGDKVGLYLEVLRDTLTVVQTDSLQEALTHSGTPEQALRIFIAAVLRRIFGKGEQSLRTRIMVHELAQPSSALPQVIEEVIRPNYDKLRQLVGHILGCNPDDDVTRLCTHSVIGQIVHYAHARPVISILWPDLKMTPDRFEQVANHIADFSLHSLRALARKRNSGGREQVRGKKKHGSSIDS